MKSNWTHIDNFVGHFFALRLKKARVNNTSLTETQKAKLLRLAKPSDDRNQASSIPDYLMLLLVEESLTVDILDILEENPVLSWRFLGGEKPTDLTSEQLIAESGFSPTAIVMLSILERDFGITGSFEKCHCLHQFRTSAVAAFNTYFTTNRIISISDPGVITKAKLLLAKLLSNTPDIPAVDQVQPLNRGRNFTVYHGGIIFVFEGLNQSLISARYIPYLAAYSAMLAGNFSVNMLTAVQAFFPLEESDDSDGSLLHPFLEGQSFLRDVYRGCKISQTSFLNDFVLLQDTPNIYGHPQAVRLPSFDKRDGFKRLDFSEVPRFLIGVMDDDTRVRVDSSSFFPEYNDNASGKNFVWKICDTKILAVGCRGIINIYVDWSSGFSIKEPDFTFDLGRLRMQNGSEIASGAQLFIARVDSVWSSSGVVILFARVSQLQNGDSYLSFTRYSENDPDAATTIYRYQLPRVAYYNFSIEQVSEKTFVGRGNARKAALFFTDGRRDAYVTLGKTDILPRKMCLADLSNYYIPVEDPPVEETESSAATSSQSSKKRK
jgi:hypothetical protein